jgi:hypothetical protein
MAIVKPLKLVTGTMRQLDVAGDDELSIAGLKLVGGSTPTVSIAADGDVVMVPGETGVTKPLLSIRANNVAGNAFELLPSGGGAAVFAVDEAGDLTCNDLSVNGSETVVGSTTITTNLQVDGNTLFGTGNDNCTINCGTGNFSFTSSSGTTEFTVGNSSFVQIDKAAGADTEFLRFSDGVDTVGILVLNGDPSGGAGVAATEGSLGLNYTDGDVWYKSGAAATAWTQVGSAAGGNTLDQAYDQGGAGGGRSITADSGAVNIQVPAAAGNDGLTMDWRDTGGGNVIAIASGAATTLVAGLDGIDIDLATNITPNGNAVVGLRIAVDNGEDAIITSGGDVSLTLPSASSGAGLSVQVAGGSTMLDIDTSAASPSTSIGDGSASTLYDGTGNIIITSVAGDASSITFVDTGAATYMELDTSNNMLEFRDDIAIALGTDVDYQLAWENAAGRIHLYSGGTAAANTDGGDILIASQVGGADTGAGGGKGGDFTVATAVGTVSAGNGAGGGGDTTFTTGIGGAGVADSAADGGDFSFTSGDGGACDDTAAESAGSAGSFTITTGDGGTGAGAGLGPSNGAAGNIIFTGGTGGAASVAQTAGFAGSVNLNPGVGGAANLTQNARNGGGVTVKGALGGAAGSTGNAGTGSTVNLATGNGGAASASGAGTGGAGGAMSITTGNGANASVGVAGAGGSWTNTLGNGGTASATAVSAAGGAYTLQTGTGGVGAVGGGGGGGGALTLTSGFGGAFAAVGALNPGAAGTFTVQGGTGGADTSAGGRSGGAGAEIVINGGDGGASTNGVGARGADVTITSGDGGAAGGTNGDGGDIVIDVGVAGGGGGAAGSDGTIDIGISTATQVDIGNTSCTTDIRVDSGNTNAFTLSAGGSDLLAMDTTNDLLEVGTELRILDNEVLAFGNAAATSGSVVFTHENGGDHVNVTYPLAGGSFRFVDDTPLGFGASGSNAQVCSIEHEAAGDGLFHIYTKDETVAGTDSRGIDVEVGDAADGNAANAGATANDIRLVGGAGGDGDAAGGGGGVGTDVRILSGGGGTGAAGQTAGNGGVVEFIAGSGGGQGGGVGGSGGAASLIGGTSDAVDATVSGGLVTIRGGTSTAGTAGGIVIDAGSGAGTRGDVYIAATNAKLAQVGNETTCADIRITTTPTGNIDFRKEPTNDDEDPYFKMYQIGGGGGQETGFFQGSGVPSTDPAIEGGLYCDYTNGSWYWWDDTDTAWEPFSTTGDSVVFTNNSGGNFAKGDAVYIISTDNEVDLGDADAIADSRVIGLCGETINDAASGEVVTKQGAVITGAVTGLAGIGPGVVVYLSVTGTTTNTLTTTAPSGTGDVVIQVGIAKNDDDLLLQLGDPIVIA